jgi:threonine synthase
VEKPETVATAIRIGNPASWKKASAAMSDSGGAVDIVTDEQILAAQYWLASHEGIFVEPASAASIAGLMKCMDPNAGAAFALSQIAEGSRIVCTVTGHGLKDPDVASKQITGITTAKADKDAILRLIGG